MSVYIPGCDIVTNFRTIQKIQIEKSTTPDKCKWKLDVSYEGSGTWDESVFCAESVSMH